MTSTATAVSFPTLYFSVSSVVNTCNASQLVTHQRPRDGVVALDELHQLDADQLSVAHTHLAVDDAEMDVWRAAEDQRRQRIVHRAAGHFQRVQAKGDEVRR